MYPRFQPSIKWTIWYYGVLARPSPSRKLLPKCDGLYTVFKILTNDRYLIEAVKGVRSYNAAIMAVDSLRLYCSTQGDENDEETDKLITPVSSFIKVVYFYEAKSHSKWLQCRRKT